MNYLPYIWISDFSASDELFALYLHLGFFGLWWIICLIFASRIFRLVMNYLPHICISDFSACDELFTLYLHLGFFGLWWIIYLDLHLGFFGLWWIIYLLFTSRIFRLYYLLFTSRIFRLVMNYLPSIYFSLGCSIWTNFSAGCNIQSRSLLSIHVEF
jgi:hypothetical protein